MKYLLTIVFITYLQVISFGQISVSLPVSGVYQTTGTYTSIVLAGQYMGPALSNYRIEYKVERLNVTDGSYNSLITSYTSVATNPQYGLFRTTISLQQGWFAVEVRVWDISAGSALSYTYRQKFGVGDVYVIAGQSNAQGYPESGTWSLPSLSTYDGILSHNYNGSCNADLPPYPSMSALTGYNRIAPSGNNSWNWAKLGQQLYNVAGAPAGGKPIAFFNAAAGGSTILNWEESARGLNSNNDYTGTKWCGTGYTGPAQPYQDFKTTLNYYSSMFGTKAILWHQGEGDNNAGRSRFTSRAGYRDSFDYLIDKTRTDYNSVLRWLVSEASFNGSNAAYSVPTTSSNIVNAQNDVSIPSYDGTDGTSSDFTFKGVQTDGLGTDYRDVSDLVHFREDRNSALTTVSGLWNTKVSSPSGSYSNIAAETPPVVTMSKSGSNWTLSVSGSYSEYRWLNMWSPNPNSPVGTSWSLSGSTSFGAWACLVKNSAGKWSISQTFYTSCGGCRTSDEETTVWSEKDYGIETSAYPMPFDKDLTIEFSIPNQSMVSLELIGINGEVTRKLADNIHDKGTYKYPINKDYLRSGVSFYRLNINGLAITKKLVKVQ